MYVDTLAVKNFRNYSKEEIVFDKGINILYGDNAQGKTNLLEAIYMAATSRSHRNSKDRDIIKNDSDESHIRLKFVKNDIEDRIDVHLRKQGNKGVAINGIPIKRTSELYGFINVILFSPEDLSIIKSGPSERRRFMDNSLCQTSRIYNSDLVNYHKVLNQRNNLLRDIYYDNRLTETLDVWDMQLVSYGNKIIKEREEFISRINEIIKEIHSSLTEGKENIEIKYEPCVGTDDFEEIIQKKRQADMKSQTTTVGPHRDELVIYINGMDARIYGSQGQQRTAALSLKLSEIESVKKIVNDNPVLLLDDVMSELDSKRREALLSVRNDIQTIITCTGYDDFIREQMNINRLFEVKDGNVSVKNNHF